jgi:hypothetical protein
MNEAPKTGWIIDKDLKIWQVVQDENPGFYKCYDALNRFKGMTQIIDLEIYPTQILAEQARMDIMKAALTNFLNKKK